MYVFSVCCLFPSKNIAFVARDQSDCIFFMTVHGIVLLSP